MSIYETVNQLITHSKKASPEQLAWLIDQAGAALFAGDLLEADEALWGSFWQGDVIAPGYLLPAAELALLRATRLDETWPEATTLPLFLADLRQAIFDPQAGVWALAVTGEPCLVFASIEGWGLGVSRQKLESGGRRSAVGGRPLATVVWYCAATERLHTGYRAVIDALSFRSAVVQRSLENLDAAPHPNATRPKPGQQSTWLAQVIRPIKPSRNTSLAARLDAEILRLRAQAE